MDVALFEKGWKVLCTQYFRLSKYSRPSIIIHLLSTVSIYRSSHEIGSKKPNPKLKICNQGKNNELDL
jgi:hypothetical protein